MKIVVASSATDRMHCASCISAEPASLSGLWPAENNDALIAALPLSALLPPPEQLSHRKLLVTHPLSLTGDGKLTARARIGEKELSACSLPVEEIPSPR